MSKPKLSVKATRLFYEIAAYAKRYIKPTDVASLPNAASDVMDGRIWKGDDEEKELVTKGLIGRVKDKGYTTTWYLTDAGCAAIRNRSEVRT
jgi:hypothetical protein